MGKKTEIVRGAPIYIQTARGIVSLVEEVASSEFGTPRGPRIAALLPHAVYLIDDQGVRSVPIVIVGRKRLLITLAAILWMPLQYLWLSRRQAYEQRRKR